MPGQTRVPLGNGAYLMVNHDAFPAMRKLEEVESHARDIAKDLADEATSQAQAHGGGQYGFDTEENPDRVTAVIFTDDVESVIDSALHSTLYKVIAGAEGKG